MSEVNSGRVKAWSIIYGSNNSSSSSNSNAGPVISEAAADVNKEGPWKSLGSSMNAISFGFVATAILISMFLIMAIFEHLFRPNNAAAASSSSSREHSSAIRATQMHKLNGSPQQVQTRYASDISVVMPGEKHPRFIGQPTPLACAREGVHWPSHLINLQS